MELDDNELKCPLCKNNFNADINLPRILIKCGHSICTACLHSKLSQNNNMLTCPEDLSIYEYIAKAEDLPINNYYLKIIEKQQSHNDPNDSFSPNQSSKAVYIKRSSTFRLDLVRTSSVNTCEEHSLPLTIICVEHKEKICPQCALKNEHKDHTVITDEEFMNQIDSLIDLFENIDGNLVTYIKEEPFNSKESLEKIDKRIKALIETINQKRNEMIEYINYKSNSVIKLLEERHKELNEKFSNCEVDIKDLTQSGQKWLDIVQKKLDILNEINDPTIECIKLIDDDPTKSHQSLINSGNSLINKFTSTGKVIELIKDLNAYPETLIEVYKNVRQEDFITIIKETFALKEDRSLVEKMHIKPLFNNINPLLLAGASTPFTPFLTEEPKTVSLNRIDNITDQMHSFTSTIQMNPINNNLFDLKESQIVTEQSEIISNTKLNQYVNKAFVRDKKRHNTQTYYSFTEENINYFTESTPLGRKTVSKFKAQPISITTPLKKNTRANTPNKDRMTSIQSELKNEIVNFNRIDIGDQESKAISSFFIENTNSHIKELKLIKTNLTDDNAISLLKAIEKNNSLTKLNLSYNALTDKSGEALISFLTKNPNMKTLALNNNLFSVNMKERIKSYGGSAKNLGSIKIFI